MTMVTEDQVRKVMNEMNTSAFEDKTTHLITRENAVAWRDSKDQWIMVVDLLQDIGYAGNMLQVVSVERRLESVLGA
jgi:hypothetical protein